MPYRTKQTRSTPKRGNPPRRAPGIRPLPYPQWGRRPRLGPDPLPDWYNVRLPAIQTPPARLLLSGDEAVALAARDAGVRLGTGYPGTPSTEILEYFSELGGKAQWAPNEKVALEVAIGASYSGARALVTMKHVGLNVAADAFMSQSYIGANGGLVIAVCDAGMGFRAALESAHGPRATDRWDDGMALEETVMRGASRFRDPGRGQGLAGVRKFIHTWDGKFSVRSGTAQIAIVPEWAGGEPLTENMPFFPGAQVQISLPERIP